MVAGSCSRIARYASFEVIPGRNAPQGRVTTRRLCVQPLLPPGRIARWFDLRIDAGRGTARSAALSTLAGLTRPAIAS
ncbi:hypothetical protein T08_10231 [Trichinella sp. T8]|nr:hypothetical protein T08_10231 [Trichinella sp. T8]